MGAKYFRGQAGGQMETEEEILHICVEIKVMVAKKKVTHCRVCCKAKLAWNRCHLKEVVHQMKYIALILEASFRHVIGWLSHLHGCHWSFASELSKWIYTIPIKENPSSVSN